MNIRSLTRISFGQREAKHISTVLNNTLALPWELQLLRDALAEDLGADETEITLPLDVLQALTYVFSKRTRRKDFALRLNDDVGYNIAESLMLAFAKARRSDAYPTSPEIDAIATLFGEIV